MFTGLIEAVGHVAELKATGVGLHLRVRTTLAGELSTGESISVNGVCLTVTHAGHDEFHADVGPETARVTTLGSLQRDRTVNLERAMRADSRIGGHFVQGHVDAIGAVDEVRAEGDAHWLTIAFPTALAAYMIRKGSVAIDGVSLTIAGLGDTQIDVMIVPHTWAHTALAALKVRDRVNVECDILGKYVVRAAELAIRS